MKDRTGDLTIHKPAGEAGNVRDPLSLPQPPEKKKVYYRRVTI